MPEQAAAAAFVTAFDCDADLSVGFAKTLSASFGTSFNALPSLSGKQVEVAAQFGTSFNASPALTGGSRKAAAQFATSFVCLPKLTGRGRRVAAQLATEFKATPSLTGASDTHGFSLCQVVADALSLWGIFCPKSAPAFAIQRAITDINTAMQVVWNQASERNYWSGTTLTLTIAAGETEQTLVADIQNVVGPCRLESTLRPLVPIGSIGELETFSDIYLDGATGSEPLAYHVNRQAAIGNDPAGCVFMTTPVPTAETKLLLDVVKQAPRYTTDDLATCPIIPIPHTYVESLLLPVVRYHASTFELFAAKEKKESIDREYLQARELLGMADPLPGKAGDNLPKRKEEGTK